MKYRKIGSHLNELADFTTMQSLSDAVPFRAGLSHANVVCGQVALSPAFKQQGKPAVAPEAMEENKVTLYPQAAPDPLLEYPLWPMPVDRKAANPMPRINRAIIILAQLPDDVKTEFNQGYESFTDLPLDQFPIEKAKALLTKYGAVLGEMKHAENLMVPQYDLQLEELSAGELVAVLLPELQEMRTLSRLLMIRAKLAMAEKRWKDVVDDCRLMFRLSEIAGQSTNFLIGRLVGFAIANVAMDTLQLAMQQPNFPNLYWSLAALPEARLFEAQSAIEYESLLLSRIFASVEGLPNEPIGEQAATDRLKQIANESTGALIGVDRYGTTSAMGQVQLGLQVSAFAPAAKQMLAETEQWKGKVDQLSDSEAVLRATGLDFRRIRDRTLAWANLPRAYWDDYPEERQAAFALTAKTYAGSNLSANLIAMLQPAVEAALSAGLRTEQTRNYLLTLEALRMHAAETGQLPETLEKLRPVPAWIDTLAAKPFQYERNSPTTAILTRTPRFAGDKQIHTTIELKELP